jgi:hypothetical protein
LEAAEKAHGEEKAGWEALNTFAVASLRKGEWSQIPSVASHLHLRIVYARESLNAAEDARGAARASVEALGRRLVELQEAIDQIDFLLTAARVSDLRPAAEPTHLKHPTVDFDNIAMPREAAQ